MKNEDVKNDLEQAVIVLTALNDVVPDAVSEDLLQSLTSICQSEFLFKMFVKSYGKGK